MGFATLSNGLQAYPRCRVPAAPLAGALLISISAVSVSCCAHLSAPDVWQIAVLGSAASITLSRRECAPAVNFSFERNRRGWIFKGLSVACAMACHPVAAFCCDGFNVAPDVSRCKQFLRYLVLPNTYCPTYIFRLQTNAACITITQMNAPEKTIVGGIRLTPSYWAKFRQVWKARGRDWMLRWIDKEHSKLPKDGAS